MTPNNNQNFSSFLSKVLAFVVILCTILSVTDAGELQTLGNNAVIELLNEGPDRYIAVYNYEISVAAEAPTVTKEFDCRMIAIIKGYQFASVGRTSPGGPIECKISCCIWNNNVVLKLTQRQDFRTYINSLYGYWFFTSDGILQGMWLGYNVYRWEAISNCPATTNSRLPKITSSSSSAQKTIYQAIADKASSNMIWLGARKSGSSYQWYHDSSSVSLGGQPTDNNCGGGSGESGCTHGLAFQNDWKFIYTSNDTKCEYVCSYNVFYDNPSTVWN